MKWLFVLGIFLWCGCKSKEAIPVKPRPFKTYVHHQDSFWLNIKEKYEALNHLAPIEHGVDSFEFRLWVDHQLTYGDDLFLVRSREGKWAKEHFFFTDNLSDTSIRNVFSRWSHRSVQTDTLSLSRPMEIGLDKLLDVLRKYHLDSFPTQASLPGYTGCCLDGTVYYYEIATRNAYRFGVYENPQCCKDKDFHNEVFLNFLDSWNAMMSNRELCWPRCK